MQKIYGANGRQDGLFKIGRNKWEAIYGYGQDGEGESGWNYRERFMGRPDIEEIKELIIEQIEADYAEKLRAGFDWKGKRVEYSEERKTDLTGLITSLSAGLVQLPITLNLSDTALVLHEFTSIDEVGEIATLILAHKTATANAKWQAKTEIDWSLYESDQTPKSEEE